MTPRDSIKDGRLSLRGGHAPERLRYKFDKALDFDLFESALVVERIAPQEVYYV